ncbi:hypothetical protein KH389_12170 [Pseudomonas qingdaonensis]|uniref:Uncharacterized protein n=1 Tax=Pseudomonas qingdaonensis TaxID=2056231 RepID=A0ABX8DYR4_9PSED|nr:hypothetical protein [Pseudomonas qingdaonensis]QVL21287.1 hypothetical protein KH389_12170 [Pseudomonas qingdaonensis]
MGETTMPGAERKPCQMLKCSRNLLNKKGFTGFIQSLPSTALLIRKQPPGPDCCCGSSASAGGF